jgi:hypothetical protein
LLRSLITSIFSDLKFLVDGWTWSVVQVPISIKAIALTIGKYVSGIVGDYREFIHSLAQMLYLPPLPRALYDAAGVTAFSVGRGIWVGRKVGVAAQPVPAQRRLLEISQALLIELAKRKAPMISAKTAKRTFSSSSP